jgi:hypothetical protein
VQAGVTHTAKTVTVKALTRLQSPDQEGKALTRKKRRLGTPIAWRWQKPVLG